MALNKSGISFSIVREKFQVSPVDGAEQKAEFPSQQKKQNDRIMKASMNTEYESRKCIARRIFGGGLF